jgi:hypothetical protein
MRDSLPGYTAGTITTMGAAIRSEQVVGPPAARVHVAQVWVRGGGHDAIATWTSADGQWPVGRADQSPKIG